MGALTAPHGQVAVVTGGGSGLGRASALALLEAGWTVVVAGRRKDALEETAVLAGPAAARVLAVPTDIRSPEEVARLFDTVRDRYDRLDLLFNNAGAAAPRRPITETPFEDWNRVLDTIVTGGFLCAREAFRVMSTQTPQGGRIINNGAPSAYVPRPNSIAYTAAKHAVLGMTKVLALDGRRYGISCGQIDVGNVTPVDGGPQPAATQADGTTAVEATIPVDRFTEALVLMAAQPPGTTIQSLVVLPTTMPFVGRG
ncbi:SDR family oxidoreductase [Kitasatospora xanthocidica]|uniref:SDR family oxidoreductase n=1 Tax=Kitasatospora xanthocidica TaxID=83382 RepID=UPI0016754684|nr:SDR family oxidoreductase [Kitasatospora xanthocidica]GHF56775.1 oxidoreductase [Kitasatospora xanthocidica]